MSRGKITEKGIRTWFKETEELLGNDIEILRTGNPNRVWNMDETSIYMNKYGKLVIAECGKAASRTGPNDKENLTILIAANAAGEVATPFAFWPYVRFPEKVIEKKPLHWAYGKSKKGWMTSEVFYEFIANEFIQFLRSSNIEFPVIIFLDGHKSHLSIPLSSFCRENNIIIVCLPPNTTHILQVLDVVHFRPMKLKWEDTLASYRIHNDGKEIQKEDIPNTMQKMYDAADFSKSLKNGFFVCGLYPWNPNNVNYAKLVTHTHKVDL